MPIRIIYKVKTNFYNAYTTTVSCYFLYDFRNNKTADLFNDHLNIHELEIKCKLLLSSDLNIITVTDAREINNAVYPSARNRL